MFFNISHSISAKRPPPNVLHFFFSFFFFFTSKTRFLTDGYDYIINILLQRNDRSLRLFRHLLAFRRPRTKEKGTITHYFKGIISRARTLWICWRLCTWRKIAYVYEFQNKLHRVTRLWIKINSRISSLEQNKKKKKTITAWFAIRVSSLWRMIIIIIIIII